MIPARMEDALQRYATDRNPVGDFLTAVLENNLLRAVSHADSINIQLLPDYVRYAYNQMPAACWGSPEKVTAWLNRKE